MFSILSDHCLSVASSLLQVMSESSAADGSSTKMSELPMKVSHYYHTTT